MITENNKLIGEFMNVDYSIPYMWRPGAFTAFTTQMLQYDKSWDWLMPVIQKCVIIAAELDEWERYWKITDMIPRIDTTYEAVVEFIKWYNEQK